MDRTNLARLARSAGALALTAILVACGSEPDTSAVADAAPPTTAAAPEATDAPSPDETSEAVTPLTLYVSNQSFADATVGITVTIDGEEVVAQDFDVEGQHNWIRFTPDIGPGEHVLEATSSTGATTTQRFTLPADAPRWAVLDYWNYPEEPEGRHFSFSVSEEPVGFA